MHRAVGLQVGPEAELWWRALRLEDDGREARRPAREDPMSRSRLVAYWVTTGLVASSVLPPAWPTSSTRKRTSTASCASATRWTSSRSASRTLSPKGLRSTCRCARSASGSSSEEVRLNWNNWVRQAHRWLSIAFTVTVIANFIALAQGGGMPPPWVTYSPLLPLALLLFTGLYLFVLPYATNWRSGRRTD